jgi:acyl-CoA thioesterase FadM
LTAAWRWSSLKLVLAIWLRLIDEELDIELTPGRLGDSSLTIQLVVKRAETVIVEGELRYVFVNGKTRKKDAIPAEVRTALEPYLSQT